MIRSIAKWAEKWARKKFKGMELIQALSGIAAIYGAWDLYGIGISSILFFHNVPKLIKGAYFRRKS